MSTESSKAKAAAAAAATTVLPVGAGADGAGVDDRRTLIAAAEAAARGDGAGGCADCRIMVVQPRSPPPVAVPVAASWSSRVIAGAAHRLPRLQGWIVVANAHQEQLPRVVSR